MGSFGLLRVDHHGKGGGGKFSRIDEALKLTVSLFDSYSQMIFLINTHVATNRGKD